MFYIIVQNFINVSSIINYLAENGDHPLNGVQPSPAIINPPYLCRVSTFKNAKPDLKIGAHPSVYKWRVLRPFVCVLRPPMCVLSPFTCVLRPSMCVLRPFMCVLCPSMCVLRPLTCVLRTSMCVLLPSMCVLRPSMCVLRPFTCVLRPSICVLLVLAEILHSNLPNCKKLKRC